MLRLGHLGLDGASQRAEQGIAGASCCSTGHGVDDEQPAHPANASRAGTLTRVDRGQDRPSGSSGHDGGPGPLALRAATALVGCQGLVLLAAAGVLVVETLTGRSTDATGARLTAVLALFGGVGLILVARALARRRRWARAPALVTQLLLLPIGVSVVQAGQAPIGVPLLLVAGGLVLLLLSQPVGEALRP